MITNQIKIIVADDDEDYHFLFEQALEEIKLPATLLKAGNGVELLAMLSGEGQAPHIIFLDINMPKVDGITALYRIREMEAYNKVPVIVFSGTENPETVDDAYKKGATLFLSKPVHYKDYLSLLESLLTGLEKPGAVINKFIRRSS